MKENIPYSNGRMSLRAKYLSIFSIKKILMRKIIIEHACGKKWCSRGDVCVL